MGDTMRRVDRQARLSQVCGQSAEKGRLTTVTDVSWRALAKTPYWRRVVAY